MFDPYRKWLGIPGGQRPPTHYQLLGLSPVEVVTSREEKEEEDAFAPSQPSGSPSSGRNEAADKLSSARSASARSSSAGADWSDGSTLSVPARRNAKITLAHGNGPFAAADGTFYRLTDGEVIGKMDTTEYDSFAAMSDADTPAWLGPQQPVSLKVQVSAAGGGTPEQVAGELTRLFESRLAADGLRVADEQPAVFTIDYSEQYVPPRTVSPPAGFPLRIPARQIPAQTQSTLTIRLQAGVASNDLWKTTIRASANDDATGGQRAAINAELARQLRTITMLLFLPKDDQLMALPAVIGL